jgi:hypothetical protein
LVTATGLVTRLSRYQCAGRRCSGPPDTFEKVRVCVRRDRQRAVPEPLGDDRHIDAGGHHERGVAVAKAGHRHDGTGLLRPQLPDRGSILGLSLTTAWRRYWFALDWSNGGAFGEGPPPHQRGTRACPRGRPHLLPRDSAEVYRELLATGATNETIANSQRVLPDCIRAHARWALMCGRLDDDTIARIVEHAEQQRERRESKRR